MINSIHRYSSLKFAIKNSKLIFRKILCRPSENGNRLQILNVRCPNLLSTSWFLVSTVRRRNSSKCSLRHQSSVFACSRGIPARFCRCFWQIAWNHRPLKSRRLEKRRSYQRDDLRANPFDLVDFIHLASLALSLVSRDIYQTGGEEEGGEQSGEYLSPWGTVENSIAAAISFREDDEVVGALGLGNTFESNSDIVLIKVQGSKSSLAIRPDFYDVTQPAPIHIVVNSASISEAWFSFALVMLCNRFGLVQMARRTFGCDCLAEGCFRFYSGTPIFSECRGFRLSRGRIFTLESRKGHVF